MQNSRGSKIPIRTPLCVHDSLSYRRTRVLMRAFFQKICVRKSQYAYLSTPDPEYAVLFSQIPYREPTKDVHIARERVEKFFISSCREHFRPHLPQGMYTLIYSALRALTPYGLSDSQYRVVDHHIPSEGGESLVRTVTPTPPGEKKEFPCLVFIHGGGTQMSLPDLLLISALFSGFTAGNIEFDDFRLRIISVELQISIVNVEYRYALLLISSNTLGPNSSYSYKARPRTPLPRGFE